VYNTDSITYSNKSTNGNNLSSDINESFYRLKYLFYLLNKDLVKNKETKYELNDKNVVCKRDSTNTSNNSFYDDIYKDLINDVIVIFNNQNGKIDNTDTKKEIKYLNECRFSFNTLENYLSSFNDLTSKIFSYDIVLNQRMHIISYTNENLGKQQISSSTILNKYLIIRIAPNPIYEDTITIRGIQYHLKGLLVGNRVNGGAGGHFWYLIKNSGNNFTEINDSSDIRKFNNASEYATEVGLYVREDSEYEDRFKIIDQICHLSELSYKINNSSKKSLDTLNYKILSKIIKNKLK